MAREDAGNKGARDRGGGRATTGSERSSEGRERNGDWRSRWLNREEIECSSNIEEDSGFARIVSVPSAFGFLGRASASSVACPQGFSTHRECFSRWDARESVRHVFDRERDSTIFAATSATEDSSL